MGKPLTYNSDEQRYEQIHGDHFVYVNVRELEGVMYLDYVYAPPELRGTGAAGCIMEGLMALVRERGLKAKPICGYAASWLRRHSEEYQDIIA